MKNIYAYTEPAGSYPQFISLNEKDGEYTLTVRGPRTETDAGSVVNIALSREELDKLTRDLMLEFGVIG